MKRLWPLFTAAIAVCLHATKSDAAVIITVEENLGSPPGLVTFTTNGGSLNLEAWINDGVGNNGGIAVIEPKSALIGFGPTGAPASMDRYRGMPVNFTGPGSFGGGGSEILASSSDAAPLFLIPNYANPSSGPAIWVPEAYASGDNLPITSMHYASTLDLLGITPGSYRCIAAIKSLYFISPSGTSFDPENHKSMSMLPLG